MAPPAPCELSARFSVKRLSRMTPSDPVFSAMAPPTETGEPSHWLPSKIFPVIVKSLPMA